MSFMYVFVHHSIKGSPKDTSIQTKLTTLQLIFSKAILYVCTDVLCASSGGVRTGQRGGENAELSMFEWAHHSAQREALYSAQPAYPSIEVTKQLCTS